MFRLLGFLLGSAVSIAALLIFLGVPEFHLSSFDSDQARFDAAIDKIREKQPEIQEHVREATQQLAEVAESLGAESEVETMPSTERAAEMAVDEVPLDAMTDVEDEEFFAAIDEPPPLQDTVLYEQQWHEFWNPFRSEIAARGFVAQLEKVTGLDYRIVKVKAGEYHVGFAYQDDAERIAKISQISAATGLELPEL